MIVGVLDSLDPQCEKKGCFDIELFLHSNKFGVMNLCFPCTRVMEIWFQFLFFYQTLIAQIARLQKKLNKLFKLTYFAE